MLEYLLQLFLAVVAILAVWINLPSAKRSVRVIATVTIIIIAFISSLVISLNRKESEERLATQKSQSESIIENMEQQNDSLTLVINLTREETKRKYLADSISIDYLGRLETTTEKLHEITGENAEAVRRQGVLSVLSHYFYKPKATLTLDLHWIPDMYTSFDSLIGISYKNNIGEVQYADLRVIISNDWDMSMHRWGDSLSFWQDAQRNARERSNRVYFDPLRMMWSHAPLWSDYIAFSTQLMDSTFGGDWYFRFQPGNIVAQLFIKYANDVEAKADSVLEFWDSIFNSGKLEILLDRDVDLKLVVNLRNERGHLNVTGCGFYTNWIVSDFPQVVADNRAWRVH
ncbi:hypothetical protein KKG05_00065 [bacterium]|nr:hypothetical protein [bacterium]